MTKRFCDLCEVEIPITERYYEVFLNVKVEAHGEDAISTWYRDFCYACTASGNALVNLLQRYEGSASSGSDVRLTDLDETRDAIAEG